jgi:hypothetical protein
LYVPAPLVPTKRRYSETPVPADQANVTVEPENLLPAVGAVIADGAVVTAAAEAQVSIASINPHASCA